MSVQIPLGRAEGELTSIVGPPALCVCAPCACGPAAAATASAAAFLSDDNDCCSEWSDNGDDIFHLCDLIADAVLCLNDDEEVVMCNAEACCPRTPYTPAAKPATTFPFTDEESFAMDGVSVYPEPSIIDDPLLQFCDEDDNLDDGGWSDTASEADSQASFCSNVSAISAVHIREAKAAAEAVRSEAEQLIWAPAVAPHSDHLGWAWDIVIHMPPPPPSSESFIHSNVSNESFAPTEEVQEKQYNNTSAALSSCLGTIGGSSHGGHRSSGSSGSGGGGTVLLGSGTVIPSSHQKEQEQKEDNNIEAEEEDCTTISSAFRACECVCTDNGKHGEGKCECHCALSTTGSQQQKRCTKDGPTTAEENETGGGGGGGEEELPTAAPVRPVYPAGLPVVCCCYDAQQPVNRCTKGTACFHRHATADEHPVVCQYGCSCRIEEHARTAAAQGFGPKEREQYLNYVDAMRHYEREIVKYREQQQQQQRQSAVDAATNLHPHHAADSSGGWHNGTGVYGGWGGAGAAWGGGGYGGGYGYGGYGAVDAAGDDEASSMMGTGPYFYASQQYQQYQQYQYQYQYQYQQQPSLRTPSAFYQADFPCHHCGSENVSAQRFPVFSGNTRRIAVRAVCQDCKRTFAVD